MSGGLHTSDNVNILQVGPIPSSSFSRDVPSPHKVILSPIQKQRQARSQRARQTKSRSKPKTKSMAFTLSSSSDSGHNTVDSPSLSVTGFFFREWLIYFIRFRGKQDLLNISKQQEWKGYLNPITRCLWWAWVCPKPRALRQMVRDKSSFCWQQGFEASLEK